MNVPAATLSRYVGTYDAATTAGSSSSCVTLEGETLWFNYDGKGKEALIALSSTRFSWSGSSVEFSSGTDGTMNLIIHYVEGSERGRRRR